MNEVIARANRLSAAAVYEILVAKRDELLTKSPLQMALEGIWQEGVDTFQAGSDYFQGVRTAGNQVIDEIAGGNVSATEAMQNLDRLQNAEARLKFHILANVGPSLIAHGGADGSDNPGIGNLPDAMQNSIFIGYGNIRPGGGV